MGKILKRHPTKEDIQMAGNMKRYSTLSAIRKQKLKPLWDYHTSNTVTKMERQKMWAIQNPQQWKSELVHPHFRKLFEKLL